MKSKKGVISVQFNWVFILIAGVLILLFFGSLVLKGKEVSDTSIANIILTNMQTIMTGAEVSVRTINQIKIPDKEIEVSCDLISVGEVSKPITKNKIIFAPEIIKGRTLLTWALDWNAPYHVTNFLYLTTPDIKYIFIGNLNDEAEELFNILPDEINKKKEEDISNIMDTGNNFKLVFFDVSSPDVPPNLKSIPDKRVTAINVNFDSNEIEFYKKKGDIFKPDGEADYLGNPMILGAMFSGNHEYYECNVKKAFNKLRIVSMIYEERTRTLRELYSGTGCISYYSAPIIDYSTASIAEIRLSINSIETSNQYLQSSSCPTIY